MHITGAIFDCDGTLVDSMGMWADVPAWLARTHGAEPDEGLWERFESISVMDGCALFHDELGLPQSAEELYEELCAHVREAYRDQVVPFEGARELLADLRAAGVPLAVASSTPVREVRCCLRAHDLEQYFDHVVSTEDVGGRDKEFPDVYLEACRRLGSEPRTTWVFEDAPFGVRTCHEAGFPVVGLFNPADGRREEDVRPWCDVFAHGYAELSVPLLRDFERPAADPRGALSALVVAGSPERCAPALLARAASGCDYVVCADGGVDACHEAGVVPDVVCGDADSCSPEALAWACDAGASHIDFPPEKYATDLSLALDCVRHEAARRGLAPAVTLACASGGRPDHALAVVGLLCAEDLASARMLGDDFEMRLVRAGGQGEWRLGPQARGRTFSAVCVAPDTRIDEEGMRWPLSDRPMEILGDLGISNVIESPDARVWCRSGAVAAFLLGEPIVRQR